MKVDPKNTEHGKVALVFANALCSSDFLSAHGFLSADLKRQWSEIQLKNEFELMIEYGDGEPTVSIVETLESWPAKIQGDIGWAYVGIVGDGFSEAVTVVVCEENGSKVIRSIIWGRP